MKERLDLYLSGHGLAPSRERARALIMEGSVYVNGVKADKAGDPVPAGAAVELRGEPLRYVSRGGLKLEKAFSVFPLSVRDAVCLDVGASTGGFTDCMLQNGAAKVYSVDVGYGQLAWSLRCDPRVVSQERTNFRYLDPALIREPVSFFTVDVSFISLSHIFPVLSQVTAGDASGVCLVKPQFEAGREKVGKKGVVRESSTHCEVIAAVCGYARQNGFRPAGLSYSPIRGPEGNVEFLLHVVRGTGCEVDAAQIAETVDSAHRAFSEEEK